MKIPKIEIKTDGAISNVYIDGEKLNGVRKIKFLHDAENRFPVLQIDLIGTDMTIDAYVVPELPSAFKRFYQPIDFGTDRTSGQPEPLQ